MDRQTTINYFVKKFDLDLNRKPPIEILKINRHVMAKTLCELNFKIGVEVGVAAGVHAEILCQENPGLTLYGIDPWTQYHGYLDYLGETLADFYQQAQVRLKPYGVRLMRKFSMDALDDFPDYSLDFVYLDGAHDFLNITQDICGWIRKVKNGGVLYGHDFKRSKNVQTYANHVQDVVSAYAYSHAINPWFTLGTQGHHDGEYREGTRSWMFVC